MMRAVENDNHQSQGQHRPVQWRDALLVWLVAKDGTYVDELHLESKPGVGETVKTDRDYKIIETPEPDDNAKKFNAQVLVVTEA